jgi:putative ABC transport system permease protein
MIKRLRFAFSYAVRNLLRDRQRTVFALFSIAAGVATVVALRMLGLMITDALTANVRALIRGDIVLQAFAAPRLAFLSGANGDRPEFVISERNLPVIQSWAAANNADVTFSLKGDLTQAAVVRNERAGTPSFVQPYFIDPQSYPFYDTIRALEPSNVLLKDLFDGPDQVVLGKRIADQIGAKAGDTIRIGNAKALHTVKGIVADTAENSVNDPSGVFNFVFGFMYLDRAYVASFDLPTGSADRAFVRLPAGANSADLAANIRADWQLRLSNRQGGLRIQTAEDVLASNEFLSNLASRMILLLSLVALVIGGVGIVNTMLVSVNRRASEIAVLKTLGLKGGGVAQIFLIEAILIGAVGSLVGVVLGFLFSFVAQSFGEQAFGIALPWRFQVDPIILGLAMGVAITVIFSILPVLTAGQVRPGLVLRQGSLVLVRAGIIPSLISLIALIVGLGTLVDLIIGDPFSTFGLTSGNLPRGASRAVNRIQSIQLPLPPGILTVLLLFIAFIIILALTWVLVWLLGKLPNFRNPNLRLAIRGLTLHRGRTALSLLALIIGMTALSGTLIMSRSINELLYTTLSGPLGGNVVALPLLPLTDVVVRSRLDTTSGARGYRDIRIVNSDLRAINGKDARQLRNELRASDPALAESASFEFLFARLDFVIGTAVHKTPTRGKVVAGRLLTPEDSGKRVMTVPYDPLLERLGITVGSTLTYRVDGQTVTYGVVGLIAPEVSEGFLPFSLGDSATQVPLGSVPRATPFDIIIADVEPAAVRDAMAVTGAVPGVFVFDVSVFDSFLNRLFSQLAALPLLVAGLSLFAATVLIATTVSLATLERRRQIGILKALGVKRRQALSQLLTENGLVGLVGGIISVLPTLLILQLVPLLTENVIRLPIPVDLILMMLALSILITLFATLLTAWGAASEKPLTVLRYE